MTKRAATRGFRLVMLKTRKSELALGATEALLTSDRFANELMPESECVVTRDLGRVRADQLLADERHQLLRDLRALILADEVGDRASMKDFPLDRREADHVALVRL